jgi:hypothetical protein
MLSALLCRPAVAGIFSDDLTRCVVKSASPADQELLVQWMFAALSLNPAVKPLTSITPEQRDDYNKKGADLFVRLVAVDCMKQATDALKNGGGASLVQSFQMLGQVAGRSLMNNPEVAQGMQGLNKYLKDDERLKALGKAAGVPEAAAPAAAPAK